MLKKGQMDFVLVGEGHRLQGRVYRGRMDGDLWLGLKALEIPVNRRSLQDRYQVKVPTTFAGQPNTGEQRKGVFLQSPTRAPLALQFYGYVPKELLRDLAVAFDKEKSHGEDLSDRPGVSPSEAEAFPRQGLRPAGGDAPQDGRKERLLRHGKRQEVARAPRNKKPAPKSKTKAKKKGAPNVRP